MNELQQYERVLDEILKGLQDVLMSGEILSDELQGMIAEELQFLIGNIDRLRAEQNEPPPIEQIEEEEENLIQQITPPEPPAPPSGPAPELPPAPYESSNIRAFAYDPETENLYVKFQAPYPRTDGPVYSYAGVPEYIFDVFRRGAVGPKTSGRNGWHEWKKGVTPSHGAAMFALIKMGGFPYQRLT